MDIVSAFCILALNLVPASAQSDGDIRLAGYNSNQYQGRVEIFHNGTWGTVCDDGFKGPAAIVVCRQVGSPDPSQARITSSAEFGAGTGIIWMDEVVCAGTETRLTQCRFAGWNNSDCVHSEDVGVACYAPVNTPPTTAGCVPDSTIRLINSLNIVGMGVVQLREGNTWYTVGKYRWDLLDARVVCRMLCYNPDQALPGSLPFNTSYITETMRYDEVECTGQETSIWNCSMKRWTNQSVYDEKAMASCVDFNNNSPAEPKPQLNCTDSQFTVTFSLLSDPNLRPNHLSIARNYTGNCNIIYSTNSYSLSMIVPFGECGTNVTSNVTHIIYLQTIKYLPTSSDGLITHANTYMVHVRCELPRLLNNGKPIEPVSKAVTESAEGRFTLEIHFYRNNSFQVAATQNPLPIYVGEWLFVGVRLVYAYTNLYLVVTDCWATPSTNRNDQVSYYLFRNKIPTDPTVSFFPLANLMFGFRYQTFKFVQYNMVYLHCNAYVCLANDHYPECQRSCFQTGDNCTVTNTPTPGFAGKRRRSASAQFVQASSTAVFVFDLEDIVGPPPNIPGDSSPQETVPATQKVPTTQQPTTPRQTLPTSTLKQTDSTTTKTTTTPRPTLPTSTPKQTDITTTKTTTTFAPTTMSREKSKANAVVTVELSTVETTPSSQTVQAVATTEHAVSTTKKSLSGSFTTLPQSADNVDLSRSEAIVDENLVKGGGACIFVIVSYMCICLSIFHIVI